MLKKHFDQQLPLNMVSNNQVFDPNEPATPSAVSQSGSNDSSDTVIDNSVISPQANLGQPDMLSGEMAVRQQPSGDSPVQTLHAANEPIALQPSTNAMGLMDSVLQGSNHSTPLPSPLYRQQFQQQPNHQQLIQEMINSSPSVEHPPPLPTAPSQPYTAQPMEQQQQQQQQQQHQQQQQLMQLAMTEQFTAEGNNEAVAMSSQAVTQAPDMLMLRQQQTAAKHRLEENMPAVRKKARRHTMSSPFPSHLTIPAAMKGISFDMPHTAAVLLDEHRMSFDHQFSSSNASTPVGTESPMTPSVFSPDDPHKPVTIKRFIKEQQRQALGPIALPPPPTPAELGLKMLAAPLRRAPPAKKYESMSREELIARLVELEQEKRSSSVQNSPQVRDDDDDPPAFSSAASSIAHPTDSHEHPAGDAPAAPQPAQEDKAAKEDVQCLWKGCGRAFDVLQDLISHIGDAHVGSGKPTYSCEWDGCSRNQKPFTKRHKMYNHLRTHTGERPFVCTKPGCEKRFSRPDSLTTHIKTHSNVRPFICPAKGCGKAYYHARSLKKHEKTHELPAASTPSEPVSAAVAFPNYSIAGPMPVDYSQVPLQHPTTHPHQHSSPHPTPFVSNHFHVPMPDPSTTLPYTPPTIDQPQGRPLHPNDGNHSRPF